MRACASLGVGVVSGRGVSDADRPIVLVDGSVEPRLIVREVRYDGVDDQRGAVLGFVGDGEAEHAADRWVGRSAAVMLPGRLIDGQVRWGVIIHGTLHEVERGLSAREDRTELAVRDAWREVLAGRLGQLWAEQDGGLIGEQGDGERFDVGRKQNRSANRWPIGETSAYVLGSDGLAWTVRDALEFLSAAGGLRLSLRWLPDEVGGMVLGRPVALDGSVGQTLRRLLEPHGLLIQREVAYESGRFIERRSVRPAERGRKVAIGWASGDRPVGQVVEVDARRPRGGAGLWVARAEGWLVESTFELVHGWDPSLEGGVDSLYSKTGNPDFSSYANVYRLWVLNEDGRFSAAPYSQGARFNLSGLCEGVVVPAQAVRFEPCVTLDDSGSRGSVVVEFSTDGGVSWLNYSGDVGIRSDRAAVYLDDADLPATFLAAAKVGQARVRVTGGIRCPVPVEVRRWAGNPFLGNAEERVLEADKGFVFARVDEGSIHFESVRNGTFASQEQDDTARLTAWLVGQMRLERRGAMGRGGRATIKLSGSWAMVRAGDRIINSGGLGVTAEGRSEAFDAAGVHVVGVRCRWPEGGGRVESKERLLTTLEVVY